ncbi:MAG: hypothetical protein IJT87_04880 [Ruminiclostridium sp.]|nr:hypothetical protein [Ruminiclostridium sp.]
MIYRPEPSALWSMTAYELDDIIRAGRRRQRDDAASLETLAFNIGALVLTAVNAPRRFPKTPEEAFGGKRSVSPDGGKADMLLIAEQINRRLRDKQRSCGK